VTTGLWPVNYDPTWLERCDGFEAIQHSVEQKAGADA
jgi:hypothetical protein